MTIARYAFLIVAAAAVCAACSSSAVGTGGSDAGTAPADDTTGGSGQDLLPSCRPKPGTYLITIVRASGDPSKCPDIRPQTETIRAGERFERGGSGCTVTNAGTCSWISTCVEIDKEERTETRSAFTVAEGGTTATAKVSVRVFERASGALRAECEYSALVMPQ